jgi:hypothetical protein
MLTSSTCGEARILLESEVQGSSAAFGACTPFTGVIGFGGFSLSGEAPVPQVKLSVELSFQQGQKAVFCVETPGVPGVHLDEPSAPPYRLSDATVPEGPTLVSSTSFVQVG